MFYDIDMLRNAVLEDSSLIFEAIKEDADAILEDLIDNIDLNITDEFGNNVVMALFKAKYYHLVFKYLCNFNLNINHQNNNGDTLAHLVVTNDYKDIKEILRIILRRKDFDPNIKNNNGETILDKSINNNYIYISAKILEDRKFNNVSLFTILKYFEAYIKNSNYGSISKMDNLLLIINNLEHKEINPQINELLIKIKDNKELIEENFNKSKTNVLEKIINKMIKETI